MIRVSYLCCFFHDQWLVVSNLLPSISHRHPYNTLGTKIISNNRFPNLRSYKFALNWILIKCFGLNKNIVKGIQKHTQLHEKVPVACKNKRMPNKVEIIGKMLNSMFSYPPSPRPLKKKQKDQNLVSLAHTGNFAKYLSGVLHGALQYYCQLPSFCYMFRLGKKIKFSLKGTQKLQKITNTVSLSQGLLSRILDLSDKYPTHFRFLCVWIYCYRIALIKIKLHSPDVIAITDTSNQACGKLKDKYKKKIISLRDRRCFYKFTTNHLTKSIQWPWKYKIQYSFGNIFQEHFSVHILT